MPVICSNCRLESVEGAKFCPKCGTPLGAGPPPGSDATMATAAPSVPAARGPTTLAPRDIGGRYRIFEKLGEGAMGAVYRGEQISLKRAVAVKVLKSELSTDRTLVRRFNAEAEAVAKLGHPNTVNIHDFGQDADGSLFIVMELVEGKTLRSMIQTEGPFSPTRTLTIASQIAASLADAHARSIVHRDLKPDNVMLQVRGRYRDIVRVLDFGIAKLRDDNRATMAAVTQAGDLLGTPQYMAPEQVMGDTIDGRADIYALGCMIYEMVTQRRAFDAATIPDLLTKHLTETVIPPSERRPDLRIPRELDRLVLMAMMKQPVARPATMELYGEQIAAVLATLPRDSDRALGDALPIAYAPGSVGMPALSPYQTPPAALPVVTPHAATPAVMPSAAGAVVTPHAATPAAMPSAAGAVVTPHAATPPVMPSAGLPSASASASSGRQPLAPFPTPPAATPAVTPAAGLAPANPSGSSGRQAMGPYQTPPAPLPVVSKMQTPSLGAAGPAQSPAFGAAAHGAAPHASLPAAVSSSTSKTGASSTVDIVHRSRAPLYIIIGALVVGAAAIAIILVTRSHEDMHAQNVATNNATNNPPTNNPPTNNPPTNNPRTNNPTTNATTNPSTNTTTNPSTNTPTNTTTNPSTNTPTNPSPTNPSTTGSNGATLPTQTGHAPNDASTPHVAMGSGSDATSGALATPHPAGDVVNATSGFKLVVPPGFKVTRRGQNLFAQNKTYSISVFPFVGKHLDAQADAEEYAAQTQLILDGAAQVDIGGTMRPGASLHGTLYDEDVAQSLIIYNGPKGRVGVSLTMPNDMRNDPTMRVFADELFSKRVLPPPN